MKEKTVEDFEKRLAVVEKGAGEKVVALQGELKQVLHLYSEKNALATELKTENEVLKKGSDALERRALEQAKEIELLKKRGDDPLLKAFSDFVADEVKRLGGVPATGRAQDNFDQTFPLVKIKTTIPVRKEHRTLPEVSTLTLEGKIVALVAEGKLDVPKVISTITDMLPGMERVTVTKALQKLAEEQILLEGKADDRRVTYCKHPDVEAKEV